MAKERFNSLKLTDVVNLDLFVYRSNELQDLYSLTSVDIYFLDKFQQNASNTDGRRIKAVVPSASITHVSTGHYRIIVTLDSNLYEIGEYVDVWNVRYDQYDTKDVKIENNFVVTREIDQTQDRPAVYDVAYKFSPKKIALGSKRYIKVFFEPNIDTFTGNEFILDNLLTRFYYNLKNTSGLYIRIELAEGCNYSDNISSNIMTDPEWDVVDIRGDNQGYYMIDSSDTGDYNIGIYSVQFKCDIDAQSVVSPKFYLQIFD